MLSDVGHKYGRAHKELLVRAERNARLTLCLFGACSYLMCCEERFRQCHCSSSKTGWQCRVERGQFGSRDECTPLPHWYIYIYAFTFMHLADAFIQSDLHCIQVTVSTFDQLLLSLGIEPMILALLAPCSTSWATGISITQPDWRQVSKHIIMQTNYTSKRGLNRLYNKCKVLFTYII